MKQLYPFLFSSLFFTLTLHAGSGEAKAGRITLAEMTRTVLAENPAIQVARHRWEAMRARVPQAAAWEDPRLSYENRLARFVSVPANAFTDQALMLEQAIPISGKNRVRARMAAAEALIAFEELRRQELDTVRNARAAYFQWQNAEAQIGLNRQNRVSLGQIAEISRAKYQVGNETAASALVAESEASKLALEGEDLVRAVTEAKSRLNVLLNRDAFAPLDNPGEAEMPPVDRSLPRLRSLLQTQRPEIRTARHRVALESARVQLAEREWIPDPTVELKAQRYNAAAQAASEVDAGVSISLPWVNRGKYSALNREARQNLVAAQRDQERVEKEAGGLLREQLAKIETAQHHIELSRATILPQSRQAFEASQFGYESGKTSFTEWISAQRALRGIESMTRESLTAYQIAVAELEAIVGAELRPPASSTTRK